jgi:hypothetical protein
MTSSSEDLSFVVHCHLRWDGVWQRPQQIFSRLAHTCPVLFIEEPKWRDGVPRSDRLEIDSPATNVWRVVPHMAAQEGVSVDKYSRWVLSELQQVLGEGGILAGRFKRPVQWFYSPLTAPVMAGALKSRCIVYDCMDELSKFRFAHPEVASREKFLMNHADIVFTGGCQLYDAKRRQHDNVHVFGCGVDVDHFSRARNLYAPLPAELQSLPRPVFGYFGVVDERIDYALLAELAQACPGGSVAVVGPLAKVSPAELPLVARVRGSLSG